MGMGLKRWRFYLKCSSCSQEMTFLTDPENDHYVTEHGCTRNFEPWRVKEEVNKILNEKKKQIESDSMKLLENKSSIIKNQLDLMDTINDLQDINKKNAFINHDNVINKLTKKRTFDQINNENKQIEEFHKKKKQKIIDNNLFDFKPIQTEQKKNDIIDDNVVLLKNKKKSKKKEQYNCDLTDFVRFINVFNFDDQIVSLSY